MIDRDQAREIARVAVEHDCIVAGKVTVGKVLSVDEIDFAPPRIYGFPHDVLKDYWVAYIKREGHFDLESSRVLLISKIDGAIAYQGSAYDEG